MEINEERNHPAPTVDFIELISQDLPWDDLAVSLGEKPDQLAPTVTDTNTCLSAEHEFNPDDLSLFSAFANSLPSLAQRPVSEAELKTNSSSVVRVEEDPDNETDPVRDIETDLQEEDFDCPDEISLSSQMECIMADILDENHADVARNDEELFGVSETEEEPSIWPLDDCDVNTGQTEAGKLSCPVDDTRDGVAECGCESLHGETSTGSNSGCQESNDSDDLTASQEWLLDELHGHLMQQHDEATRINSLRVRLPPPPGTPTISLDPVSRAIHAFTTEVDTMKLDMQLTDALLADTPEIPRCCKLLDDYSPYELRPGVLVQFPFFAGTVDVCCHWEGEQSEELQTAARRLRAFMIAMYVRHSVHEGFLTALNRQVAAYRRAMVANSGQLAKVMRKLPELNGLSKFYSRLYTDWDEFLTQFYEPDHQLASASTGRCDGATQRQCKSRQTESHSGSRQSARVIDTMDQSQVVAAVSNKPAVVSDKETSHSGCRKPAPQESVDIDAESAAGLPVTKRPKGSRNVLQPHHSTSNSSSSAGLPVIKKRVGRPKGSRNVLQPHHSTSNSSLEPGERRLRPRQHDVDIVSVVKPRDDVTAEKRRGRPRNCAVSRVDNNSKDNDVKPVIGTLQRRRTGRHLDQTALGIKTARKNGVEVGSNMGWTRFEEQDMRVMRQTRRLRSDGCVDSEDEDVKPDIDTLERNTRNDRKRKESEQNTKTGKARQSRLDTRTGRKNGVEVVGEMVETTFEEDVKPDLSSLAVNMAPVDSAVLVKRRRLRESGITSEDQDIKPDISTLKRTGKCRTQKQGTKTGGGGRKNGVEVDSQMLHAGFEEQDVKPDLRSLGCISAGGKIRRRLGRIPPGSPNILTRSMIQAKQQRQCQQCECIAGIELTPAGLSSAAGPPLVSPSRSTRSPPFKLLSPSQIKVEVES